MNVDPYGRIIYRNEELIDLILTGHDISDLYGDEVDEYNDLCRLNDKPDHIISSPPPIDISPEAYHGERASRWIIPKEYQEIDVWGPLLDRCANDQERERLLREKVMFCERGLEPVLRLMIYLVDSFRSRNIVWGVGRGSSVASFALYLIGINKINPIRYGLDIGEFLRD